MFVCIATVQVHNKKAEIRKCQISLKGLFIVIMFLLIIAWCMWKVMDFTMRFSYSIFQFWSSKCILFICFSTSTSKKRRMLSSEGLQGAREVITSPSWEHTRSFFENIANTVGLTVSIMFEPQVKKSTLLHYCSRYFQLFAKCSAQGYNCMFCYDNTGVGESQVLWRCQELLLGQLLG